ncbi:MAG TPA: DMT family transporter [Ktedonobacteraceae bacterium]|nr:DMT family transporter [Ktedonobacteraceae bacterium]
MRNTDSIEEQALLLSDAQSTRGRAWKYDLVPLLITIIWGATFLVTKLTLRLVGPFTYLSLCYLVATVTLVLIFHKRLRRITRAEFLCGLLIGVVLFAGYAFQTVGMQWTSVSKTGFITGLYVPLVPLFSLLFLRQRIAITAWLGVLLSLAGLFLLSVNKQLTLSIGLGEWLLLICAFAFAIQIVLISKFAPQMDAINLAIIQLALTTLLSFIAVPLNHEPLAAPPLLAWVPIFLLGMLDMAFTLVCMNWVQQYISGTRAALIYSLEPLWAAFFGVLLAGDVLSLIAWIGCGCIFAGMVVGRLEKLSFRRRKPIV